MSILGNFGTKAATTLSSGVIGEAMNGAGDLAIKLRQALTGDLSPEQRTSLLIEADKIEAQIVTARNEIALAEAKSNYKSVVLARPMFLYVMYIFIIISLFVGVVSVFDGAAGARFSVGMKTYLAAIPSDLWALFGAGYLGYSGFRTLDKKNGVQS